MGDSMGRKRKTDLVELQNLRNSGLSIGDIAKKIGVNKSSVSKGLKKLGMAGYQDVVLRASTEINNSKLNAMDRLNRISIVVENELIKIQEQLQKATGKDRIPWEKIQLEHLDEIRKQINLLLDITQTLYKVDQIDKFKGAVLSVLSEVDPALRDRFFKLLKERRNQTNIGDIS